MRSLLSRGGCEFFLDGRAHKIAPFCPRAVVVLDVVIPEQVFQHEPSVRTALANTAVSDHFAAGGDSLALIELLQLIGGLEGAVFIGGLRPGDVRRRRNMPGALRSF